MMQEKVLRKRLHNLEKIYFAETMKENRNRDKWFLGIIEQRMRQEKTKLTLLKIGQHGN
jgi:hypothetical protein